METEKIVKHLFKTYGKDKKELAFRIEVALEKAYDLGASEQCAAIIGIEEQLRKQ